MPCRVGAGHDKGTNIRTGASMDHMNYDGTHFRVTIRAPSLLHSHFLLHTSDSFPITSTFTSIARRISLGKRTISPIIYERAFLLLIF